MNKWMLWKKLVTLTDGTVGHWIQTGITAAQTGAHRTSAIRTDASITFAFQCPLHRYIEWCVQTVGELWKVPSKLPEISVNSKQTKKQIAIKMYKIPPEPSATHRLLCFRAALSASAIPFFNASLIFTENFSNDLVDHSSNRKYINSHSDDRISFDFDCSKFCVIIGTNFGACVNRITYWAAMVLADDITFAELCIKLISSWKM